MVGVPVSGPPPGERRIEAEWRRVAIMTEICRVAGWVTRSHLAEAAGVSAAEAAQAADWLHERGFVARQRIGRRVCYRRKGN